MKEEYRQFIVRYLTGKRWWVKDVEIGKAWFCIESGDDKGCSDWASPKCKELVERGVLERSHRGNEYRLREEKKDG